MSETDPYIQEHEQHIHKLLKQKTELENIRFDKRKKESRQEQAVCCAEISRITAEIAKQKQQLSNYRIHQSRKRQRENQIFGDINSDTVVSNSIWDD